MSDITFLRHSLLEDQWKLVDPMIIKAFPEFSLHSPVIDQYFPDLYKRFDEYQFVLMQEQTVLGVGNAMPLFCDGAFAAFPEGGVEWGLETAAKQHEAGIEPNLLCALQIVVDSSKRGMGLSYKAVEHMIDLARQHGLKGLIAPVRPNRKEHHPRMPMEEYVAWKRDDGLPYDDWLRVHVRLGGEILNVCPRSEVVPGTIAQWEKWAGRKFEASGEYEIEGGLVPITIDLENDHGLSVEPNIWVIHRV